jgi:hypothetical protein
MTLIKSPRQARIEPRRGPPLAFVRVRREEEIHAFNLSLS